MISEKLSYLDAGEVYTEGYVVFSSEFVNNSDTVAVLLLNENGLYIYRHRPDIPVETILKAVPEISLSMRRHLFDLIKKNPDSGL